jgi:hypothetical protein
MRSQQPSIPSLQRRMPVIIALALAGAMGCRHDLVTAWTLKHRSTRDSYIDDQLKTEVLCQLWHEKP